MRLSRHYIVLLACSLMSGSFATKLDFSSGMFSIGARSATRRGSLTGFGAYSIALKHRLLSQVEMSVGYSVVVSGGISGDLGYGFDVGADYFPLTSESTYTFETAERSLVFYERWRPYVGLSFHQRQFQSIQAGFAGVGIRAGIEYPLSESLAVTATARYILYSGSRATSATELDLLVGMSLGF